MEASRFTTIAASFIVVCATVAAIAAAICVDKANRDKEEPVREPQVRVVEKLCQEGRVVAMAVAVDGPGVFTIQIDHEISCRPNY